MNNMSDTLRILNLEDNKADAELNEAMLSARWTKYRFLRVETQPDFLGALAKEEFDVILSDYTMPGFNGVEALALARERRPETPFIFVSGTIGEDAAIEALKKGATDYVLKHRLMRLIPAVDRALRDARERVERERAELAMRESEHKYRTLFESIGDAAFLVDRITGKIIDVNQRAVELLGDGRSQILGRMQSLFLALEPAKVSSTLPFRSKLLLKDGSLQAVEVHTTMLTLYGRPMELRLCHLIPVR
jgi:PAS domain S-box-containing protein